MKLVLPEDQFLNVLSYLVVDSVFAISSTCRQLHEWCSLFKVVHSGDEKLGNGDLAMLVRRFPAVNDLTLRFDSTRNSSSYQVLGEIGPQLVSLKLTGAKIIAGATFRDMVCRFQSMKYLSLDGTFYVRSDAMSALASAGQQLQEVSLCGFRQLEDEDVQLLLDSCPVLTALSVADCTTLGTLVLSSFQLQTLDVSRCIHISEMSLVMPSLIRLDASWCTKLPDSAVEALVATCLSLEDLGLKGCSALISPSIHSTNLRILDLSLCGKLTMCNISCLLLTELSVARCMGLSSLALDLPMMKELDLSMLGIVSLTLNCTKLEYVNLRGSYKLSSTNIQSRCPALSVVDLCGTNINPEAFSRSDGESGVDVIQRGAPLNWHTY